MLAARRWHLAAAAAGAVALVGATWAWRSRRRRRAAGADAGPPLREDRRERALSLLKLISADDLLGLLRAEHPQTVAVILSQLPIERAAAVLSGLDPARQAEVSRRVARLETVDEQLLAEIGEELTERLEELLAAGDGPAGGSERLAELLHHAGRTTERNVIGRLEDREPDLADSLRGRLLRFEDLERVSAWQLRAALERTDSGELALALRVAGREAVRKVLASLPAPRARQLRCEIQRLGPVRLCDVETAQQRLLEAVRSVEDGTYCPAPDPAGQDREPRGTARPWHA
jgi:flagellar motor switch protein FliG